MSDPPGMKCSHDDSTSPDPKCHNTEHSNIPHPSLSKKALESLKATLRFILDLPDHVDEDDRLEDIYNIVQRVLRPIRRESKESFVDQKGFKINVSREKQAFNEVVQRAAKEGASEEDLHAVIAHSMCTCYGTDRVMN
jgi:hypothetical protein